MRQLVITGLAQETDFENPAKAKTVLVINKGELRIPVDETSVQQILEIALKGYNQDEGGDVPPITSDDLATPEYVASQVNGHNDDAEEEDEDDDDFDAEASDEPGDEVFDDTGISQL